MTDKNTFKHLYYAFLQMLTVFVNAGVRLFSLGSARFFLPPNLIYAQLEVAGAKPFVISREVDRTFQAWWLTAIRKFLKRIPFLGPLSVVSENEFESLRKAYASKSFRLFKQMQKFCAVYLTDQSSTKPHRRGRSLAAHLRAMGIRVSRPALSPEEARLAIETHLEQEARSAHQESGLAIVSLSEPLKRNTSLNFLDSEHQLLDSGFRLSDFAANHWAQVWPQVAASAKGGWLRTSFLKSKTLEDQREQIVSAEMLIYQSEQPAFSRFRNRDALHVVPESQAKVDSKGEPSSGLKPFCTRPFNDVHVTCEGDVYPCCFVARPYGRVGQLRTSSMSEIWHSPALQEIRDGISKGTFPRICAATPGCPHIWQDRWVGSQEITALPRYMELNLPNTHCNIGGHRPTDKNPACIMCDRNRAGYRFEDDSHFDEVLESVRTMMPGLEVIHIQGWSEPFWKDAIFKTLDKIDYDTQREKTVISTTSNGTIFTPARQEEFLRRCAHIRINFSLDASTNETYRKIRRIDMFEAALENIRHWGKIRRRHPSVYFRIQNNINLLNVHEVVGMVQFAAEVGVDEIEFNPTAGDFDFVISPRTAHVFKKAEALARAEAERLGVRLTFLRPLDLELTVAAKSESELVTS